MTNATNAAARYARHHARAIESLIVAADAIAAADAARAADAIAARDAFAAITDAGRHIARVYDARAVDIDARAAIARADAVTFARDADECLFDTFAITPAERAVIDERRAYYRDAAAICRRAALRDAARAERYADAAERIRDAFANARRDAARHHGGITFAAVDAYADAVHAAIMAGA
jgi:hypothetical protein